jgi:chromosome segregation ATPase
LSNYTEDEIIHVLNKHREEKYKSGRLSQDSNDYEEISSLRQQLGTLRKYTQQAQEETVKYKQGLSETLDKLNECETEKQRLLRENEDLHNRIKQLENPSDAYNQLQEALEQGSRQKQRIERMTHLIQEKDAKITELQQFEYSFKRAGEWKIKQQAELEQEKERSAKWEEEFHQKNRELEDCRHKMGQLEKLAQILKEQLESSNLEAKRNHEEATQMRQLSIQLTEQQKELQRHLEDVESIFNTVQSEKKDLQDELEAITAQFESLRQRVQESHLKLEAQKRFSSELQMESQKVSEERDHLLKQLAEKTRSIESFDQEIDLIKQTLMRAMREAKDIEVRYQECVSEKVSAVNKSNQLQNLIERQREDLAKLRDEILQVNQRLEGTLKLKEEKEVQLQKAQDLLIQREHELESCEQNIHQLTQFKIAIEDDLKQAQEAIEDREQRLKLAQQHLAKKVKETTQLNEAVEEQKLQIQELSTQLNHAKDKISEVQCNTEMLLQQEKKIQEQLAESLKLAESQSSKWEAKYFNMHEKWQELEARNRELRSLEEKYNQMQTLLSGLGNFIASPANPAPAPVPTLEIQQVPKIASIIQEPKPKPVETKTLFDAAPVGGTRSKKSLFD